eukprot:jgi/Botrbrau1/5028/Bobra.0396s0041.1
MAASVEVQKLTAKFKESIKARQWDTAKTLLSQLKLKLTELPSLPPLFSQTPTAQQELSIARDILEHAVFLSVHLQNEKDFERNFLQLQTYYTDTRSLLPPSSQESLILALNLLRLLVQNRIAEFHTDLELIPPEALDSDYVKYVIQLEQWLMEGAYNKVLDSRVDVPDQSYSYFMEKLLSTVRDEIAGCSERAYPSLSLHDAQKLMMFSSIGDTEDYAIEKGWSVKDGVVFFQQEEEAPVIPVEAVDLIGNTLTYAREMERIV